MNSVFAKNLLLAARLLVALTFLTAGFHKLLAWQGPAMWMASKGFPAVNVLLGLATAIELVGGLLLAIGYKGKWVALGLFVFLLATTVLMHTFWNMSGMAFQTALLDFIQNLAILGGLLAIAALGHLKQKSNVMQKSPKEWTLANNKT